MAIVATVWSVDVVVEGVGVGVGVGVEVVIGMVVSVVRAGA